MRHSETTNGVIGILVLLLAGICALGFHSSLAACSVAYALWRWQQLSQSFLGLALDTLAHGSTLTTSREAITTSTIFTTSFPFLLSPHHCWQRLSPATAIGEQPRVGITGITSLLVARYYGSSSPYFWALCFALSVAGSLSVAVMQHNTHSQQPSPNQSGARGLVGEGSVWAVEVIVVEEGSEVSSAVVGGVVGTGVGPFAAEGLDEAFGFPIGLGAIGSGEGVF